MKIKTLVLIGVICWLESCSKKEATEGVLECDPNISYSNTIRPIFINSCSNAGCHDGIILPSLAEYLTAKDASVQIKNAISTNKMPINSSLSANDKAAIICWINNGSKNN